MLGGGPAGATAARLLALWGHRVTLLTRPAPRGSHALAESLPPSCEKLLRRAELLDAVNDAGFVRSLGHTVRWAGGETRAEPFGEWSAGWQVPRAAFDALLIKAAKAAGAAVRTDALVRSVESAPGRDSRVLYEVRGKVRALGARWVLDCTGRAGLMSRRNSGRVKGRQRTVAIVATWERRPDWALADDSHTLVESYDGGWAWSVPLSRTRRQVTVMIDPSRTRVAGGKQLAATYRAELARTAMLAELTAAASRARMVGAPWARDASSYSSSVVARGRTLLVGDAASFVDPLSSFGVKKALASAWLASVVVHSALAAPEIEKQALAWFTARERAMVAGMRKTLALLARDASLAHPAGFWADRISDPDATDAAVGDDSSGEPDVAALKADGAVLRAFEEIRTRESLQLVVAPGVKRVRRAVARGNLLSVVDHYVTESFPHGVRYIRNVDLMALSAIAVSNRQVPEMYGTYIRSSPQVPLPDFLGALAVMVGKGLLDFA